jgi:hypothetical protein
MDRVNQGESLALVNLSDIAPDVLRSVPMLRVTGQAGLLLPDHLLMKRL